MQFKYADLKKILEGMTDEQLNQDVTIEIGDEEFAAAQSCGMIEYTDILDAGHIYLSILLPEYTEEDS